MTSQSNRLAAELHCDLMRQGFMKGLPVPARTAEQKMAAKEYAARIIAKLEATEARILARSPKP
jgi:hypothetical protein